MDPATGAAHLRQLRHLGDLVADVRDVLVTGDLDAPVPACPDWTLGDLARHLGEIHRWVRGAIVDRRPDTDVPPGPVERDALIAWYDEGAGALLDLLGRTDPDEPCWAFGPKPALAGFWFRRQAHEHAVHAFDARASQGETLAIDPALALDGVDEVIRMFFPRQVRLRRTEPLTRALRVEPDGSDRAWQLAGAGTDPFVVPADATVAGPAEALYLLLWRRAPLDDARLRLSGDRSAAQAVLGAAIVP